MPILTVDLTALDLAPTDASGWVEAVDTLGNPLAVVSVAGERLAFAARSLEFSLAGVATIDLPSTATLTDGALYRVHITRLDTATVPTAVGPFALTADAHLHELPVLPPADVAASVAAIRDAALGDAALIRDQALVAKVATEALRDEVAATVDGLVPLRVRSDVASPYAYIGTAPVGTADAGTGWLVSRIHLTAHETQTATGAWDDRAVLPYES